MGVGVCKGDGRYGKAALIWAFIYLATAGLQQLQARNMAKMLAKSRGHEATRLVVKPTFGNTLLWRSIYAFDGRFYVDGVRPWPYRKLFEGTSIATLNPAQDFPWLEHGSTQALDVDRFTQLSEGYVAKASDGSPRVFDVRYSFLPTETAPMWYILLTPGAALDSHAIYATDRTSATEKLPTLIRMITATP